MKVVFMISNFIIKFTTFNLSIPLFLKGKELFFGLNQRRGDLCYNRDLTNDRVGQVSRPTGPPGPGLNQRLFTLWVHLSHD